MAGETRKQRTGSLSEKRERKETFEMSDQEVQQLPSADGKDATPGIRFRIHHELELLLHVMGHSEIFGRGATRLWEEVATRVEKTFPQEMAGLTGRTCRDRVIQEIRMFVANDNKCKRRSGSEEEFTRKDELLEELATRFQAVSSERETASAAKKAKAQKDLQCGKELREAALLDLTQKMEKKKRRKEDDGTDTSGDSSASDDEKDSDTEGKRKKKRRSGGGVADGLLKWLQNKTASDAELRARELELKARELELRRLELEHARKGGRDE